MKKTIIIFLLLYFIWFVSQVYAASVIIMWAWAWQTIKVFSSMSDLNSNTNPLQSLTTWSNNSVLYSYTANSTSKVYIKAELNSTIDSWWVSEYTLVSWDDNILSLWVWWTLSQLVGEIDSIKGPWFVFWIHSLSSTSTWWISSSDKNDIANLVRQKVESSWSLLSRVYDRTLNILTRIFSIKWDTQKIN